MALRTERVRTPRFRGAGADRGSVYGFARRAPVRLDCGRRARASRARGWPGAVRRRRRSGRGRLRPAGRHRVRIVELSGEGNNVPLIHLQAGPSGVPVAVPVAAGAAVGRGAAAVAAGGDGDGLRRGRRGGERGQRQDEGGKRGLKAVCVLKPVRALKRIRVLKPVRGANVGGGRRAPTACERPPPGARGGRLRAWAAARGPAGQVTAATAALRRFF